MRFKCDVSTVFPRSISLVIASLATLCAAQVANAQPVPEQSVGCAPADLTVGSNGTLGDPLTPPTAVQFETADPVQQILAGGRRLGGRQSVADCMAEAERSGDIIVCGSTNNGQTMPVPEVFGPIPGSTDGAAVDPRGPPCGASISNQCWGGVDLIGTAFNTVRIVGLLLDPDKNLGEGTRIPERFRGANR